VFADGAIHLVASELAAKSKEARDCAAAVAELKMRVAAQQAFEQISVLEGEEVRYQ
jgi:hypothetical protein